MIIQTKKLNELGISIALKELDEALPSDLVKDVIKYCIGDIIYDEIEEKIKSYRFRKEIEDFRKENDKSIDFYIQHKKELEKDRKKLVIFYSEFLIRDTEKFEKELFEELKSYPKEFFDHSLRESILEEQEYKCFLCKCDLDFVYPHLHHIDYDKMNCLKDNLVFLCPRCHGRTNGNRGFWKVYLKEYKGESNGARLETTSK
jgi:hypothetical protein